MGTETLKQQAHVPVSQTLSSNSFGVYNVPVVLSFRNGPESNLARVDWRIDGVDSCPAKALYSRLFCLLGRLI